MRPKNAFMLILTAFIWGTAFVAQSVGMDYLGPFTFNGVRSLIGGVALIPCIWLLQKLNDKSEPVTEERNRKDLLIGGISCGVLLFAASSLQQVGIQYTTAGKAGFITAFYIVFVPVLGIFLGKKTGWKVWTAVILALAGLYFLCITEKFTIGKGDIFLFACALVFSIHILVIDYFSPKVEGVKMSCIQFLVCGIISLPFMFLLETPRMGAIVDAAWPLLYAGVLSCGVAYTLQIIGQKNVNPAIASLILSLESCFSVLAGWVILGEKLSVCESIGCILMFAAIILAQLPDKKDKEMAKNE
ncbi:MAG: DMT family transporter [Lachnospiraceae bacterium]|nr:DMT family transporter [Lachnospiraceae bacterium]